MKFAVIFSILLQANCSFAQFDPSGITNKDYSQSITTNNMKTKIKLSPAYGRSAKLISPIVPNSGSKQFKVDDIKVFLYMLTLEDTNNMDRSLRDVAQLGATVLDNSSTKKSYVFFTSGDFYYFDGSEMLQCCVYPGGMMCQNSCIEIADADGGMDAAMSQFVADIENNKLTEKNFKQLTKRYNFAIVTPMYFFSDGPGPGGAAVVPVVESIDATDGILKLTIKNPVTNKSALISIDIKSKKVIKSIVDGQEMDINTRKPFASPLKGN